MKLRRSPLSRHSAATGIVISCLRQRAEADILAFISSLHLALHHACRRSGRNEDRILIESLRPEERKTHLLFMASSHVMRSTLHVIKPNYSPCRNSRLTSLPSSIHHFCSRRVKPVRRGDGALHLHALSFPALPPSLPTARARPPRRARCARN